MFTLGRVLPEFLNVDYKGVRSLSIPVFMFMGRHDYTTPAQPTADWLAQGERAREARCVVRALLAYDSVGRARQDAAEPGAVRAPAGRARTRIDADNTNELRALLHSPGRPASVCTAATPRFRLRRRRRARRSPGAAAVPQLRAASAPAQLQALNYDQYRDIRFRPDRALWRAEKLPFELMFFHLGKFQTEPVRIERGRRPQGARHIRYRSARLRLRQEQAVAAELGRSRLRAASARTTR